MRIAKVGVVIDRQTAEKRWDLGLNVFEAYVVEIFAHAGIPYDVLQSVDDALHGSYDILVAALIPEDEQTHDALLKYVEDGGHLISYGGLPRFAKRLGYVQAAETGTGYTHLPEDAFASMPPLRYISARPWRAKQRGENGANVREIGTLHDGSPNGASIGSALLSLKVGRGTIHRWAVHIPTTIVHLQQGTGPVLSDGVPAPDGTAEIDEGILKADDRIALDWELDRARTQTGVPYFAYPHADYWRKAIVSQLIRSAQALGLTLPFIDTWPDGISDVALISFDSDFNIEETAMTTLDVMQELQVPTTWCMIEPGYSQRVYARVRSEGHELALHYNALDQENGRWGEEEFARQFAWCTQAIGSERITSNKNHYTRFEGWDELFKWCEQHGIAADQTRGPTKRGNVGFLFGTCQPYFPIAWSSERNRLYNVLEIGFLTQDMNHPSLADTSVIEPFLAEVKNVSGVAHFLFHQIHIHRHDQVRQAIRELVEKARAHGYTFWTSKQINDWVRARRTVKVANIDSNGNVSVQAEQPIAETIVIRIPVRDPSALPDSEIDIRYGVPCIKQTVDFNTQRHNNEEALLR